MPEVTRFRIARAPQRRALQSHAAVQLTPGSTLDGWFTGSDLKGQASDRPLQEATQYLVDHKLAAPAKQFQADVAEVASVLGQIRWLDDLLASSNNTVAWKEVNKQFVLKFQQTPHAVVASKPGAVLREDLSLSLLAATISNSATPALRADILRLVLVIGLVELAEARGELDADAVFKALRWCDVILPRRILEELGRTHSILARSPGRSDLYIVREEWNRYEVGEIAHIENVLKGEVKERLHERTDEQETTLTLDTESTKSIEADSQTTDRAELKHESKTDTDLAFHIDGKVETSGQYGPTHVDTHLGGTFDYSVKESEQRATTQAQETVTRAASKVEEKVRRQRVDRTLTRIRTSDKHSLDNKDGPDHVIGIYRWVDKVQTVQVFKYPHRLLFEFEVPEPGAFIRWQQHRPRKFNVKKPIPFTVDGTEDGKPILADMMTGGPTEGRAINYLELGRRYDTVGLVGPLQEQFAYATLKAEGESKRYLQVQEDEQSQGPRDSHKAVAWSTSSAAIPENMEAFKIGVVGQAINAAYVGEQSTHTGWVEVIVGTQRLGREGLVKLDAPEKTTDLFDLSKQGTELTPPLSGTVPTYCMSDDVQGAFATLLFWCRPTSATTLRWQLDTFELIQSAYWANQRQYDDAVAQSDVREGITIVGDSPTRNAEIVREEIKRNVIELLMGNEFKGFDAVHDAEDAKPATATEPAQPARFPRTKLDVAADTAAYIQFLEQAFEWENISFVFYPYFWTDERKWSELQSIKSPDPDFDRFLRSGSARVILPARPGFEGQANLYTLFGTLWGGGPVPVPNDPLYLSIADEIRAQQQRPADGEPQQPSWEVRLPTTLVYLERLGTVLPLTNANAELPTP